jgi:hypothetical protein
MLGLLSLFELLFPVEHVQNVVIFSIFKHIAGSVVTCGEFLRWLGLWFLMATTSGCDRRAFWSLDAVDQFGGAPFRLNDLMSRCRFDLAWSPPETLWKFNLPLHCPLPTPTELWSSTCCGLCCPAEKPCNGTVQPVQVRLSNTTTATCEQWWHRWRHSTPDHNSHGDKLSLQGAVR